MHYRFSLGMLLALAGGCTSIVGLDGVGFTGTGGTGATGATGGSGGDTTSSMASTGGGGAGTTSSMTSTGGGGAGTTSSTASTGGNGGGTTSTTTSSSSGTTSTPVAVCGDGDVNFGEQCEDGNTMDGDGCSSECLVEPFYQCDKGDPDQCTKHEVICDDGVDNDGDGQTDSVDADCAIPPSFSGCDAGQKLHVYKPVDVPDNIPDGGEGKSVVIVADSPIILRAAVSFSVTHPEDGDLEGDLTRIPGSKLDLFTQAGGTGENFTSTVLDSMCASGVNQGTAPFTGCYKPEDPFSSLVNANGHGMWELKIKDDVSTNTGQLVDWALILCVQ